MLLWFNPFIEAIRPAPIYGNAISPMNAGRGIFYDRSVPAAKSRRDEESAAGVFAGFALAKLRDGMGAVASSLTALGNRMNAFFSQIVATLAFQRVAREYASPLTFRAGSNPTAWGYMPFFPLSWLQTQSGFAAPADFAASTAWLWQPFAILAKTSAEMFAPAHESRASPVQFRGGAAGVPGFF